MKKWYSFCERFEKPVGILHALMCLLNIGSVFFGVMAVSGGGNEIYRIFRSLSLSCALPMVFMRLFYLQYIVFGLIAVFSLVNNYRKIQNKSMRRRTIAVECTLWIVAAIELLYLEQYYINIIWF